MHISKVEKLISKLKKAMNSEMGKKNYDNVLSLVTVASYILYQCNIEYIDKDLEQTVKAVATELQLDILGNDALKEEVVLFWDGFGFNERGLCQIYLRALTKHKKVVYVTYNDRANSIPDIHKILEENNGECLYINRNQKNPLAMINELNSYLKDYSPKHMFFYSWPEDVVATPLLYAYENKLTRYQINLTDHAFWLGAGCFDKYINFREYGARITDEYREVPRDKNVVIPFYPIIDYEKEFQGYPFELNDNQKVIFSGGALYKTLGEGNKYYSMVEHILEKHEDVIFWYAGYGNDTELKKVINKYPNRVYFTKERSDLYQVLQHCHIYFSTYPLCGGLMFQYAAMAGKVPVTLKYGNVSDDFLINQKKIDIEFDNVESLYAEVDKLLTDEEYYENRSQLMKKSVISEEVFNEEVGKLVSGNISEKFQPEYGHIDTVEFRQIYLDNMTYAEMTSMLFRKHMIKTALKYYPFEFIRGTMRTIRKKIKKKLNK